MNLSLSSALHPLSFEIGRRLSGSAGRDRQLEQWNRIYGPGAYTVPRRMLAEHPMVASSALQQQLDAHVDELLTVVKNRLAESANWCPGWPNLPRPDVISADLAIVEDLSRPEGWALRWVEFQAFTSTVSALHTLHLAANELWPEVSSLLPWKLPAGQTDWLTAARAWAAPAGGILLEHAPEKQFCWFDVQSAVKLFGLTLVEPSQLVREGTKLLYRADDGSLQRIDHVFNRLVMHELSNRAEFERLSRGAEVSWHSHPAWYYGISKAWLPHLPQKPDAGCTSGANWRALGLPAEQLVAKDVNSHGGAAVHLHVDERFLDSLTEPDNWVVQSRYKPQPLFKALDGQAIFGEVRCVVALPENGASWSAFQFLRLSRSGKSSAAAQPIELPGSGLSLLYRPPEL